MEFLIPPSIGGLSDSPMDLTEKTFAYELNNFNPLSTGLKVRDGLYLWGRVPPYTGKATIHSFKGKFPNNPFNENIVVCTSNSFYNVNFKEIAAPNGGRLSTGAKQDTIPDRLTIHRAPSIAGRVRDDLDISDAVSTLYTTPQASNMIICNPNGDVTPIVLRDVGGETFITRVTREVEGVESQTGPLDLIFPFEFQERLCFIERDSFRIWYDRDGQSLPNNLILNDFLVTADFKRGGHLLSAFTIGTDTGAGWKNFIAFMTTEGEVAVYTIPDEGFGSTQIALNDVYYIGRPLGPKAFFELNGDVFIATERGLLSFKTAIKYDIDTGKPYLSNKIWQKWKNAVDKYPGIWTITEFSSNQEDIVLISPPSTTDDPLTFVWNTQTGAWSTWDVRIDDSTVLDDTLYILSGTNIYRYQGGEDTFVGNKGDTIDSKPINARWTPRFISLSEQFKSRMKHARIEYTALQPISYKPFTAIYENLKYPAYPNAIPSDENTIVNEIPELYPRNFKMNGVGKRMCVGVQASVQSPISPNAQFQSIEIIYDRGAKV